MLSRDGQAGGRLPAERPSSFSRIGAAAAAAAPPPALAAAAPAIAPAAAPGAPAASDAAGGGRGRGAPPSARGGAGAAVRQRELVQAHAATGPPAWPQQAGSARPGAAGAAPAVTVVVPEVV